MHCFETSLIAKAGTAFSRTIWHDLKPIEWQARIPTAVQWLSNCLTTHPRCRSSLDRSNKVAARFLEVEQSGTEFKLRLTSTQSVRDASLYYIALTRWGGIDMPCKTTKHNVDQHFRGIDFATLPLSFRETVELTAAHYLRYLWVD